MPSEHIDDRTVFLSPAGSGRWYNRCPGYFHTSESCAERGTPRRESASTREWFLERAVQEGYRPCGTCAADIEHDFEPADYPPGTLAAYPGVGFEVATDGGSSQAESAPSHPTLEELSQGDTVRVEPEEADVFVADVDDVRQSADGAISSHAVTVVESGYRPPVWDLEARYDPRDGWGDVTAVERLYRNTETEFVDRGAATVEQIEVGIDPVRLDPGVTVESVEGDHYRIVVPPWEREYDDKALAFNLDSKATVCERLRPDEEVVRRVE